MKICYDTRKLAEGMSLHFEAALLFLPPLPPAHQLQLSVMPVRGKKKKPEQGQPPGGAVGRGEVEDELEQQSLYPSLASLHSQEDEEEFSCGECCRNSEQWVWHLFTGQYIESFH